MAELRYLASDGGDGGGRGVGVGRELGGWDGRGVGGGFRGEDDEVAVSCEVDRDLPANASRGADDQGHGAPGAFGVVVCHCYGGGDV